MLWSALIAPNDGHDTVTKYEVFWDNGSGGLVWALIATQTTGGFTYSFIKSTGI